MKVFSEIPKNLPNTPLLDSINIPEDIKKLNKNQLIALADELREFLLYTVGKSGGHLGAGLGVVELTVALHYIFDTPKDNIVWDVGHQAYPHKIITGRKKEIETIRKKDGLAPFPRRSESDYDAFGVGHSSTSISAALGMAFSIKKTPKIISIIPITRLIRKTTLLVNLSFNCFAKKIFPKSVTKYPRIITEK